jgi:hypothetical protein
MLAEIQSARLTNINEVINAEQTPICLPNEPKLTQYKNSVWEGRSRPNNHSINEFLKTERIRSKSDELTSGSASIVSSEKPKDILDINWANIHDWVANWGVLPLDERLLIKALLTSDLEENANRYGLKCLNLGSHLLQCVGMDMTNIIGNGVCAIRSNLRDEFGYYSDRCANNRALDPGTCRRAFSKFLGDNEPQKLFKAGKVAFHAVVNSDESFCPLGKDIMAYKEKLWKFYGKTTEVFRKLKKKKLVTHMIYVHEMAIRSLLEKEMNPHTHVMFFFEDNHCGDDELEWSAREIVAEFNRTAELGVMSPSTKKGESEEHRIKIQKRWNKGTKSSVGYYFRVYSTVQNYLKEITPNNIRELNLATRETWWTVKELMSGKAQRRFGYTRIR